MEGHNHSSDSPYKLLNELEKEIQNNYSATILNLSKALMTEINKEIKSLEEDKIF